MIERRAEQPKTKKDGVIFALVRDGNIYLQERKEPGDPYDGYTIVPGGGIEEGETSIYTLEREVLEELGVKITDGDLIGSVFFDGTTKAVFLVKGWEGEVQNKEPDRCNVLLLPFEKAKEVCKHQATHVILDMVQKKLSEK